MAIIKKATFSYRCSIKALNKPEGEGWDIYNFPNQIKIASINIKTEDLGGFNLKEATKEHPDHLYVKIFAIEKDKPNDNGDSFNAKELKKAADTFVGVPLFTNHQNDDVEKSRGECVHSWYDEKEGGIYIIGRVDKIAYPRLARGIEEGYISGCFPPDAPVLMSDGTEKNICDIEDGDEVISGKGNIKRVLGTRQRGYNYPLYSIQVEGHKQPLVCTSHHNLMVYRLPLLCACGCEEELMVKKDSRITSKTFNREFKTGHNIRGKNSEFNYEYIQKIKACELEDGDFLIEPKFIDDSCDNYVTEDEAFLIGLFLAEGSFEKRKGVRYSAIFNFAHTEIDTLAFQCEEKLKRVFKDHRNGPTTNYYPGASQSRVNLYGKDIAQWFYDRCGEYSDSKKLNKKLLKLGKEKTSALLAGFIEGDGYNVKKRKYGLAIVSASLISQLRLLFDKIGVRTNYRVRTDNKRFGYKPVHELTFGITTVPDVLRDRFLYKKADKAKVNQALWHNLKDYTLRKIKKIQEIEYDGIVYDIEIEDDHTYCVDHIAVSNTSMGCSVEDSICSVCHNKSNTAEDYCSHISNRKNRKYSGDLKCAYHNSPVDKEEKCPLCGSTKDDIKTIKHEDQQIFEHNYGLKFIENSFVVNPACHNCGVTCVLHAPTVEQKIASLSKNVNNLIKHSYLDETINKVAGMEELNSLKHSMTEMESVVKSMLKQKENVSMEYVSDLVKAMSDVQNIFDELIEMGYGGLPSPPPVQGEEPSVITEQFPEPIPPQNLAPQSPSGGGVSETSDLGGLGNLTMPKKSSKNKEDFISLNENILNKARSLEQSIRELNKNINSQLEIGAKMAIDNKTTKVAAGADNLEVITEKQLTKQEETLHPRTGEVYEGITESKEQLAGSEKSNDTTSESPQVRKGTYDTITEDQFKTQSALGDAVIHFNDYPDVITEKQWNDFSRDIAGDLPDDYTEQITQSQVRELLTKHKFIGDIETITEDQLRNISMTDGLKRWASKDYSVSLVKTATNIIADMISQYMKSPDEIRKVASFINDDIGIKTKVSFLAVANSLPHKKDSREAIASKAKYFNKTASKDTVSTIDALIFTAAKHGQFGMKAEDVLDFVGNVINSKTAMTRVDTLLKTNETYDKIITKADAFDSALKELDRPKDGLYRIKATMEDIGVPITDKEAFLHGVKKFAQEIIDDNSVTTVVIKIEATEDGSLIIDVQDGGESEITTDDIGDAIEGPVEDIDADMNGEEGECGIEGIEGIEIEDTKDMSMCNADTKTTTKIAAAQKEIKEAQMMGGEMGGMGGASQAPGAGASLPQTPPMSTPPLENFSEEPGLEGEGEGFEDTLEPLPPGSICPVCGSDDVDIIGGKGKCNNCSSEMTYKVEVNVTKWQGTTPSEEEIEGEAEEGFEGEGFEMPTDEEQAGGLGDMGGPEMGEIPAAASVDNWRVNKFAAVTKLTPEVVKKASENGIKIGSVSPATGSTNTVKTDNGSYICLDTGTKYKVSYMVSKNGKQVYGQWEWEPKMANATCPSCNRAKQRFIKALASIDMKEEDFNNLELKKQVDTIIKLKQTGSLKPIKTASKKSSVMQDYKLAYGGYGDKFPIESCIEKLARRFGKDAICLSGPDEGKPLAQSVCNRLKKADIYTDKISIKLANNWSDCDGDEECITHQIRSGYSLRQAAEVCSALKIAVADGEEFLADDLTNDNNFDETPIEDTGIGIGIEDDVDPFEEEQEVGIDDPGGTVMLELPVEIVEQLEQAIEVADGDGIDEGIENGINEEPIEGIPGEEPIEGIPGEEPIDESIAPGELDGEFNECNKPDITSIPGNEREMKPAVDPTQNLQDQPVGGGEMKSMEVGFDQEQENGTDIIEKDRGDSLQPQNKVVLKQDGIPVSAENLIDRSIGKVGKAQMDLSNIVDVLNKNASEKEISQEKAQDSKDIGPYTAGEDGSKMGHENETIPSAGKPSVPRENATMGQEPTDLNPQDKPQPVIPSGDAVMGHEKEVGLDGGDDRYTGGDKGQGKTELASTDKDLYHMRGFGSSKDGISSLADRIAKKLAPKEPVAKDPDIQPISDGGAIGKEDKFTADEPTNVEGSATESLIGHENETLEKAPKEPADQPDVFTGNAQQGKEKLDSEKTIKDKGTVIADRDSESEAIRVAGLMLQSKKIEASELSTKVKELKGYKPEQIRDIEKAIFANEKGLNTVSDGNLSQTVQINENSNVRNNQDDLSRKITSLFTLGRQNREADDSELVQLRKTYGK